MTHPSRSVRPADPFEDFIRSIERIKTDDDFGRRVYGSITNTDWSHPEHGEGWGLSFRAAGRVIAEMREDYEDFNYMKWYCSSPEGVIDEEFEELASAAGWSGTQL